MTTNELREAAQRALTVAKGKIESALDCHPQAVRHLLGEAWDSINEAAGSLATNPEAAAQAEGRGTPSARWRVNGEADPHAGQYDCERAALTMGNLTDDELANGAFLNYDIRPNPHDIIAGRAFSPIAWMTAVKDRIRWLSRSLEAALAAQPVQAQGEAVDLLRAVEKDLHDRGLTSIPIFGQVVSFLYRGTSPAPAVDRGLSEAQEREAFEDWGKHSRHAFRFTRFPASDEDWPGQYKMGAEQAGWEAWQARAALSTPSPVAPEPTHGGAVSALRVKSLIVGMTLNVSAEARAKFADELLNLLGMSR